MPTAEPDLVAQLRATLKRLELAFEELADAMVRIDAQGTIRWCNKAFQQFAGQPPDKLVGTRLAERFPLDRMGQPLPDDRAPVDLLLDEHVDVAGLYKLHRADQELIVELSAARIQVDREYTGAVLVFRDVTPHNHRAEAELRTANQLLEAKIEELEFMNRVMMEREARILELKMELKALRNQLGPKGVDGAGPLPAAGP